MTSELVIAKRFCGPPESGNGGYVCGVLAKHVDGVAEATLRRPPPLDVPLKVQRNGDGSVHLMQDDTLVAEARPISFDLKVPPSPGLAEAQNATKNFTGYENHIFPTCFVCGPDRDEGDALRIFPGNTGTGGTVAAPWTPHSSLADEEGNAHPEFVWSALDCPGSSALTRLDGAPIVLGRLAVQLHRPVQCGEDHVVIGWPVGHEGRKHFAGTAIFTSSGDLCAVGHATWITINQAG